MVKKLTKDLLNWLFEENKEDQTQQKNFNYSKYQFLSNLVFYLGVYDDEIEEKWGKAIFEVMCAIRDRGTFEYIGIDDTHYERYLLVCQLLYQKGWISWGSSIRCAWYIDYEPNQKIMLDMLRVSIADERFDEEGIAWSIENVLTLLEWVVD